MTSILSNFGIMLILGFIWDLIIGDPSFIYHPVIIIGRYIALIDKIIYKIVKNKTSLLKIIFGLILWLSVVLPCFFIPFFIIRYLKAVNLYLYFVVNIVFVGIMLANKSLKNAALLVIKGLKEEGIEGGRKYVGYIVGRDTKELNEDEVIKATIETVAENASDGIIAPSFYFLIFGLPGLFAYKAVNTLDSMVGYKNEKYLYLGRVSAKADDLFNFIPARISGLSFIISAFMLKPFNKNYLPLNSLKIFLEDRYKHLSPNSAQGESAVAGALGICLGGTHKYFGKEVFKPTIGTEINKAKLDHIIMVNNLLYTSTTIAIILMIIAYELIV